MDKFTTYALGIITGILIAFLELFIARFVL